MEIPRDVADAEGVPEDLDSSLVGPYTFPSPVRRRRAGVVFAVGAVVAGVGAATALPAGMWAVAAALAVLAAYHFVSAWDLELREGEALARAGGAVDFPVGHASAVVGFDGWRSRPIWNVLLFSSDDPPSRRGLVRVDAVTGVIVETYVEDVPADG